MGKNQRARRAAKERKRAEPHPQTSRSAGPPTDSLEAAGEAIEAARQLRRSGRPALDCVGRPLSEPDGPLDKVIDTVVGDVVQRLFNGGWTPVDLVEISRRQTDQVCASYLLDEVVAATAGFPDALVDPRWRAQLDQYDASETWDPRQPRLSQWALRNLLGRREALAVVIDVLAVCERLPRIERTMTPPGTPPPRGSMSSSDPAQEKALAKVRALLAKAESSDYTHEAEAFSAKAQELMSRYALDRALVDHAHGVKQHASLRRIWLDNPYLTAKSMLVNAVASANRSRTVLTRGLGFTTVVGDEVDLSLVELLSTSLLLQGTRAMLSSGSQNDRYGVSRTRSFRQSFLVAYATRIGERLRAANEASEASAGSGALLPVLSARRRAVDELIDEQFPKLVAKSVSVANGAGWGAGRAAADLAQLEVRQAVSGHG